jgi:hypothetical protein
MRRALRAVGTATGLAGYLCVPEPILAWLVSIRRPQHCPALGPFLRNETALRRQHHE